MQFLPQNEDANSNNSPIGLSNTVTVTTGVRDLEIALRHLPAVNETPVKLMDLATQVAGDGIYSIDGTIDVSVTFPVNVQQTTPQRKNMAAGWYAVIYGLLSR